MKKVVSATLAGALAVGMVPAMALADDAVEVLSMTDVESVQAGKIVAFQGGFADGAEFVKGAAGVNALVPINVQGYSGDTVYAVKAEDVYYAKLADVNTPGYKTESYRTLDGKTIYLTGSWSNTVPTEVGNYVVAVNVDGVNGSDNVMVKAAASFSIVPADLSGDVAVFEYNASDTDDLSDTKFEFKDAAYTIGTNDGDLQITVGGKHIASGYSWGIYDANTNLPATAKYAGNYYVKVTFTTGASTSVSKKAYFTVDPISIASATVVETGGTAAVVEKATADAATTAEAQKALVSVASVNGAAVATGLADNIKVTGFDKEIAGIGAYKATVAVDPTTVTAAEAAGFNASISGSAQADFVIVTKDLTGSNRLTIEYNGIDNNATTTGVQIDRTKTSFENFNSSKVVVKIDGVATNAYDLVVTKKVAGTYVPSTLADLAGTSNYGDYKVKAVLKAGDLSYTYGGASQEIDVTVTNGAIQDADVSFTYEGKNATSVTATYDGTDLLEDITVAVKCGTAVVPASDYTVVVEKKNAKLAGTPYEEWTGGIVEAGDYVIYVKSDKYDIAKTAGIAVKVNTVAVRPMEADQIATQPATATTAAKYTGKEFIYSGQAINPIEAFGKVAAWTSPVTYATDAVTGKVITFDLPASSYKLTITKFQAEGAAAPVAAKDLPTEFKAAGYYEYTIADVDQYDSFVVNNGVTYSGAVTIVTTKVFPDVATNAWYADEVLAVAQNGWITGYDNGMFGPNDGMKRGDLALVLARALGMTQQNITGTIAGDRAASVNTGFADVNGKIYYAWAVKAMDEAGIMGGYDNGKFGAEDLVTRQQLATILARLDASGLGDASILASALDAYADADEVAGWAVEGVEWAVENGIMGVDTTFLNPTDTVSRAEVAAMMVRYNAEIGGLKPVVTNVG